MWANGWQMDAALALHTSFREQVLLPAIWPSDRALLCSRAGPHAGAWLAAIPADPATTFAPEILHLAPRRQMHLPLPLARARCAGEGAPGCRALVDNLRDHALACPPTGLLARRGFGLERAWIQVVREAKAELCHSSGWPTPRLQGSQQTIDDGSISSYMVLPHAARPCAAMQHSCHLSDAMAAPKRERLSGMGSQLRRHSAALACYPELTRGGPHRLCVLAAEVRGPLERRIPALGATPRCNACAPCRCHAAHRSLTGMGKALVGCLGGCGPVSDMQRCPRSLDNSLRWCRQPCPCMWRSLRAHYALRSLARVGLPAARTAPACVLHAWRERRQKRTTTQGTLASLHFEGARAGLQSAACLARAAYRTAWANALLIMCMEVLDSGAPVACFAPGCSCPCAAPH